MAAAAAAGTTPMTARKALLTTTATLLSFSLSRMPFLQAGGGAGAVVVIRDPPLDRPVRPRGGRRWRQCRAGGPGRVDLVSGQVASAGAPAPPARSGQQALLPMCI